MYTKGQVEFSLWRAKLLGLFLLIFAFFLGFQIFKIQFLQTEKYQKNFETRVLRIHEISAQRGTIFAKDGRILAVDLPYYDLHFDATVLGLQNFIQEKTLMDSLQKLSLVLASLFPEKKAIDYVNIFETALKEKNKFKIIQKNLTFYQKEKLFKLNFIALGKNKNGLIFLQKSKRYQPQAELAKRTIGYLNEEGKGVVGLEQYFSKLLSGETGLQKQKRVGGSIWLPLSDDYIRKPKKGADLHSSLDLDIQDLAHQALKNQLQQHQAQSGLAIVMEVETGYIRALVNLSKKGENNYIEDFNYAVGGYYEPGSTFKIPVLMVALEDGKIQIQDSVETSPGVRYFYDLQMKENKKEGYGKIPLTEALAYSTNIGIADVIWKNYAQEPQKFIAGLERMGLHQKTNIEITGEKLPYFKNPSDKLWSGITLPQMSIGYEVLFSPIQILTFYNAIANQGKMMRPKLIEKIVHFDGRVEHFEPEFLRQIASKKTIAQAQEVLQKVVEIGSARVIKNPYFTIAGKTGTAQVLQNDKKIYKDKAGKANYYSSFVGYFPADQPKYSIFVAVSEPTKGYYSSEVAAPIFKQIAYPLYVKEYFLPQPKNLTQHLPISPKTRAKDVEKIYKKLGFLMQKNHTQDWVQVLSDSEKIIFENLEIFSTEVVPQVTQMALKDAIFLLQKRGFKIFIEGKFGVVKTQSLVAGTKIPKNREISLGLSD